VATPIWKASKPRLHRYRLKEDGGNFWGLTNRELKAKLCDAFVTMVQAADFWKSNDPADGLYWA
jgi:hypothetical protein